MSDKKGNSIPKQLAKSSSTSSNKVLMKKRKNGELEEKSKMKSLVKRLLMDNERLKREQIENNCKIKGQNIGPDFEKQHKSYINEKYNTRLLSIVSRIISGGNLPDGLAQQYPINTIILKVCRYLLLNEIELSIFSIYLDRLGWNPSEFDFDDNLLVVAILAKMNSNSQSRHSIENLFKEVKGLEDTFNYYIKIRLEHENHNVLEVSIKELNERFDNINQPFNAFCKDNFIDYNFCVDQILSMSLPYSENKKQKEVKGLSGSTISVPVMKASLNGDHFGRTINANQVKNEFTDTVKPYFNIVANNPFLNFGSVPKAQEIKKDYAFNLSNFSTENAPSSGLKNIPVYQLNTIELNEEAKNEKNDEINYVGTLNKGISTYNFPSMSQLNSHAAGIEPFQFMKNEFQNDEKLAHSDSYTAFRIVPSILNKQNSRKKLINV